MRRESRRRQQVKKWWEDKRFILSGSVISLTLALIIGVAVYSNDNRYNDYSNKDNQNQIISLVPQEEIDEETESASTSVGKSVEESQLENSTNSSNEIKNDLSTNTITNNKTSNNTNTNSSVKSTKNKTENKQTTQVNNNAQEKQDIEFEWPVKGDILKAFSADNLLYSSTLQEWTVHNGIDIKADKTSIVCAAADGTIKSIKNDPRYGLSVVIEHENGFKTVYSNLLTSEFVVEGERVSKGQTIGTVGNSANFEVSDDSHLHFEMLKDGEYIDPTLYLK